MKAPVQVAAAGDVFPIKSVRPGIKPVAPPYVLSYGNPSMQGPSKSGMGDGSRDINHPSPDRSYPCRYSGGTGRFGRNTAAYATSGSCAERLISFVQTVRWPVSPLLSVEQSTEKLTTISGRRIPNYFLPLPFSKSVTLPRSLMLTIEL